LLFKELSLAQEPLVIISMTLNELTVMNSQYFQSSAYQPTDIGECEVTNLGKNVFSSNELTNSPISFWGRSQNEQPDAVVSASLALDTTSSRPVPKLVEVSSDPPDLSDATLERPIPILTEEVIPTSSALPGQPIPNVDELGLPTSNSTLTRPVPDLVELSPVAAAPAPNTALVQFTNLVFSGDEGTTGTIQVKLGLTQAPTTPLTLSLNPANFLVVDADNNLKNGTQSTLTFTSENWNTPQTIWFMAEVDGVGSDRPTTNLAYTLSGTTTANGSYNLGVVRNTYVPDTTKFNIDLDFRNDTTGYWTEARRAIAQRAADTWANLIANEWSGLQLNTNISLIGDDGNYSSQTFAVKRYVDDLAVFIKTIDSNGTAGGFGAIEYDFGGWISSPDVKPRVAQVVIDPAVGDTYLYNTVLHELGHALGLVGLNWEGFQNQQLASPQTAVFTGLYSTAANNGKAIPLQSQDGPNSVTGEYDYWHPANSVFSVMSYGYIYSINTPTAIDMAMLADSGYQVYRVNTPKPVPLLSIDVTEPIAA